MSHSSLLTTDRSITWMALLALVALAFATLAVFSILSATAPDSCEDAPSAYVLTALDYRVEVPQLGTAFWFDLAREGNLTWEAALHHCRRQQPTRPNCRTVLKVKDLLRSLDPAREEAIQ